MQPADRAWLALAGGVLAWDVFGVETLSSACDRYHQHRPWVTRLAVAVVALHLLDWLPRRIDPLGLIGAARR